MWPCFPARLRKWRRSSDDEAVAAKAKVVRVADAYDARIDAELAELD